MRLAIIADDITGACDCGVQLLKHGIAVAVVLAGHSFPCVKRDVVAIDTNSRYSSGDDSYKTVRECCRHLREHETAVVYKKIDSCMRGNIGQELNAVHDVFNPDFVIIAPGHPRNGRQVINGTHYFNHAPLHESEVAKDPRMPLTESGVARMISRQAGRQVGHISYADIRRGCKCVVDKMEFFKQQGIAYITADSVCESDLESLMASVRQSGYSVVWAGSAGLIEYLPEAYGLMSDCRNTTVPPGDIPVLFVMGSLSGIGREQLSALLRDGEMGLEMKSSAVVADEARRHDEIHRLRQAAQDAFRQGRNVALHSSDDIEKTRRVGEMNGHSPARVCDLVSATLSMVALELIKSNNIRRLFLTGGDTAHQVISQLSFTEYELIGEVEPGVPIGILHNDGAGIYVVTKAGSFGTKLAMINSLQKLRGV